MSREFVGHLVAQWALNPGLFNYLFGLLARPKRLSFGVGFCPKQVIRVALGLPELSGAEVGTWRTLLRSGEPCEHGRGAERSSLARSERSWFLLAVLPHLEPAT